MLELFERAPSGARSRVVPRLEIIVPGAGYSAPGAFCYVPMGQKEDEQKETKLMKTIQISDVTLRMAEASALSFKERVEIARTLDRLGVDAIELPVLRDGKAGTLSNKTIASVVSSARLSAAVGMTEESVEETWESVKGARQAALHVMLPASSDRKSVV